MGLAVVEFVPGHHVDGVLTEAVSVGKQLIPGVAARALMFLGQTSGSGGVSVVSVVHRGVVLVHDVSAQGSA